MDPGLFYVDVLGYELRPQIPRPSAVYILHGGATVVTAFSIIA